MKKYSDYKDSENKIIGNIPKSWNVKRFKYLFNYKKGKIPAGLSTESNGNSEVYLAMDYLRGKPNQTFYVNDIKNVVLVKQNDILLLWDGANAGELIESKKGVLSSTMAVIKSDLIFERFAWYSLKNAETGLRDFSIGMGIPHVNGEVLKNLYITYPVYEEQIKIAKFLDSRVFQIDKLINDKEKLIELLYEERTAIINQAVTKGIVPTIPMKYSGIDWLGEIPEHWGIVKIKYVSSIKYGLGQPPKQKDGGMKIIRATNIFRGIIKEDNMVYVDPDDIPWNRDPVLKEDDIIVVRSGAYTGDSAIITKVYAGSITGYDIVVRAKTVHAQFLAYALLSTYLLDNQLFLERLRAAQPHLNAEEIGNCFLLEPPFSEQINIVNHIKSEHVKIDELIEKIKHEVVLLKEYKIALVSEVVTGKIDVRNQPTESLVIM